MRHTAPHSTPNPVDGMHASYVPTGLPSMPRLGSTNAHRPPSPPLPATVTAPRNDAHDDDDNVGDDDHLSRPFGAHSGVATRHTSTLLHHSSPNTSSDHAGVGGSTTTGLQRRTYSPAAAVATPFTSSSRRQTSSGPRRLRWLAAWLRACLCRLGLARKDDDDYRDPNQRARLACVLPCVFFAIVLLFTFVVLLVRSSVPGRVLGKNRRARDEPSAVLVVVTEPQPLLPENELKSLLRFENLPQLLEKLRTAEEQRRGLTSADMLLDKTLVSRQVAQISHYLQALHQHDPTSGLSEFHQFLTNGTIRAATLANAVPAPTPAGEEEQQPTNRTAIGDAPAATQQWLTALKTVFAGLPEATRLRAQLRGFAGVSSGEAERLTRQPFDDLAVLQYRHAWAASEVLPRMAAQPEGGVTAYDVTAYDVTAYDVANRAALKADVYAAASIHNHVYFHPLRRYAAVRAYGAATVADTDAWYSEAVAAVQARCGVAPPAPAVSVSVGGGVSLSVLSMPRLSAAREAEVTHLLSAADQQWMPEALRASAAVNTHTIFVSLASYRDAECSPTVLDMFRTARNPHRVYVGLAQQNRVGDTPCVLPEMYAPFLCPSGGTGVANALEAQARGRVLRGGVDFGRTHAGSAFASFDADVCFLTDHVRVREIDGMQAKGPTYGRYMAMLLYRGEDLTLVLDSHNKFRPMWDTLGSSFLKLYDDPKAALSHYPEAYDPAAEYFNVYHTTTAYLCRALFHDIFNYMQHRAIVIGSPSEFAKNNQYNDPYVKVQSKEIAAATNFRLPQPWIAGGFLLINSTVFRDVPFDPHLLYVFDGEEVLFASRLWTHGYNLYSPPICLCFHIYGRTSAPKLWDNNHLWYWTQDQVRPRLQYLLRAHLKNHSEVMVPADTQNPYVTIDVSRYGMGKQRTIEQWYEYAGADPIRQTLDGKWCGLP